MAQSHNQTREIDLAPYANIRALMSWSIAEQELHDAWREGREPSARSAPLGAFIGFCLIDNLKNQGVINLESLFNGQPYYGASTQHHR